MTADVELLPCPFCGNEVQDDEGCFQSSGLCFPTTPTWSVRCGNPECNVDVSAASESAAIAAWNRRATAAKDAEIEALVNQRDFLVEEYERAVGCGSQGYTHAAMHLFNAITNAKADENTKVIEALRAEREVIAAEAVKYADKSGRLEAKVERLTEALRKIADYDPVGGDEWLSAVALLQKWAKQVLHPTAAQENDDA